MKSQVFSFLHINYVTTSKVSANVICKISVLKSFVCGSFKSLVWCWLPFDFGNDIKKCLLLLPKNLDRTLDTKAAMSKLVNWGASLLKRRPLLTNTVVYATFYSAAEISQQTFNKFYSPEKPDYDLASAARIVTVGTTVYAPALYYLYKFLDYKFVGTTMKIVAIKVASDQFFLTPILLATFYSMIAYLENRDINEFRDRYWKTLVANQCFWLPGQTINFYFVPAHLRVVYVSSASFIWINVLCFIKREKVEVPVAK